MQKQMPSGNDEKIRKYKERIVENFLLDINTLYKSIIRNPVILIDTEQTNQ